MARVVSFYAVGALVLAMTVAGFVIPMVHAWQQIAASLGVLR